MYCRKCGNKLENNQKFCGKCGAKVAGIKSNDENIIDNFIMNGNKSKNETNVNTNSDENSFISSTISNGSSKSGNNYINNSKTKQSNNKSTNPLSKSKKISNIFGIFNIKPNKFSRKNKSIKKKIKQKTKKQRKRIDKRLKYGILVGILTCFIICGIVLKLKWKFINAHNYVIASFDKTYNKINNTYNIKQFDCLKLEDSDNSTQNMYFTIIDAKGGFNNNDVLKSLKGLSLNIGHAKNLEKNVNNYEFVLKDKNKNKLTTVDIKSSDEDIVLFIPELYENQIGLKNCLVDKNINYGKYQTIDDLSKVIDDSSILFEFNELIKDKNRSLFKEIMSQCKISYNGEKERNREYKALINGKIFVDCLVKYFDSIEKDDKVISVFTDFVYVTRAEKTLKDSKKTSIKSISRIVNSLKKIQEDGIDNVEFIINTKDNIINSINCELVIKNMSLGFNFVTNYNNDNLNYDLNFDIIDVTRDIKLDLCFKGNKIKDKIIKNIEISLDVLEKKIVGIDIEDRFNTKTLSVGKRINTSINEKYDTHNCIIDLSGKFNIDGDVKEFNIERLKTNISTLFSNMYLDFRGYIRKTNTNNINILERNNVEYINILDTNTTNLIEEKINTNFNNIINSFIKCIL